LLQNASLLAGDIGMISVSNIYFAACYKFWLSNLQQSYVR
jgi:hypothetical protein